MEGHKLPLRPAGLALRGAEAVALGGLASCNLWCKTRDIANIPSRARAVMGISASGGIAMAQFDYLISARRVRGGAFEAEPGAIKYLKIPAAAAAATPAHEFQGTETQWIDEVRGGADGDENPNSISPTGDLLVFIHGYNNSLESVLWRQRKLAADLRAEQWRGLVIGFDWPSGDETLGYLEDRADAAQVAIELVHRCVKIIVRGQQANCKTNIHLLAHSTGAYVVMEAFTQAEKVGKFFKSDWRIGQVAFISGDVASSSLSLSDAWSKPMFSRVMRLTNYQNGFDAVLGVSNAKRLGVAPRSGRIGLPLDAHPKATNVDCSNYFQMKDAGTAEFAPGANYTHSWQIGDRVFARDLAMTLEGAIDRYKLPTRAISGGQLFLQDGVRPAFQAVHVTKPPMRDV
jgi:esterase/lipase superfamily enzyme